MKIIIEDNSFLAQGNQGYINPEREILKPAIMALMRRASLSKKSGIIRVSIPTLSVILAKLTLNRRAANIGASR